MDRTVLPTAARPPETPRRSLPPIVAKTVHLCVNCVQGVGRGVRDPLRRRYRRFSRAHLVVDIVLAVAVIALLGVNAWVLGDRLRSPASSLALAWDAPASVRVGDRIALALAFQYNGDAPLERAAVTFQTADAIRILRVAPGTYDAATRTLILPTALAPGASGTIVVDAVAGAQEGSTLTIRATFSGTGGDRAELMRADIAVPVRGIAMVFDLDLPEVIPSDGFVRATVRYRSDAAVPLERIAVVPVVHAPLAMITVDRDPLTLAPGASGESVFTVRTAGAGSYGVDVEIVRAASPDEEPREILARMSFPLTVVPAPVRMETVRRDGGAVVALGDRATIATTFTDSGNAMLATDARRPLRVHITGPLVSASRFRTDGGAASGSALAWPLMPTVRDHPIRGTTWDGSVSVSYAFDVPRRVDAAEFSADTVFAYAVTPSFAFAEDAHGNPTAWVEGLPFTIPVRGEIAVAAFARYYTSEGDQMGHGPLPPVVHAATTYWVTWEIRSAIEDAERIILRATLPENVQWTGRHTAVVGGQLDFDPSDRMVSWVADGVDRTIGSASPVAAVSFEVSVLPRADQRGAPAMLLGPTTGAGAGGTTDVDRFASALAVTTDLVADRWANGKGIVVSGTSGRP